MSTPFSLLLNFTCTAGGVGVGTGFGVGAATVCAGVTAALLFSFDPAEGSVESVIFGDCV
ncbi:hypothetical protein D3C73_1622790 [compost metagenome]